MSQSIYRHLKPISETPYNGSQITRSAWDSNYTLFSGHQGNVLDIAFSPFNDQLIASASEDCTAKLWKVPESGQQEIITKPLCTLNGHRRKVGEVKFNMVANNIVVTTATDMIVRVWDIEMAATVCSVTGHTDIITSVDWSEDGSLLATVAKDKKVRLFDPRQETVAVVSIVKHSNAVDQM